MKPGDTLRAVRILHIDQDAAYAESLRRWVADPSRAETRVDWAQTLAEGLQKLETASPDLVIAELDLSDSKGLDTIERIAVATDRPIIALSASYADGALQLALQCGAYDAVQKSRVDPAHLQRLVRLAAIQAHTVRSLRHSEARFRNLLELSSDWYWEQDENFRFVEQPGDHLRNPAARPARFIGMTRWEAHAPSLTPQQWEAHRATLQAHRPFQDFEYERVSADGARRWVSISGAPIIDASGRFRGYRGVGRDITERKREERILQLEHRVARCLADAADADAGIQAVMQAVCESYSWQIGRYWRADDAAGVLRYAGTWASTPEETARSAEESKKITFARGTGLAGRTWQSGEPTWVTDTANDPRVARSVLSRDGMRGAFVFPVTSQGCTLGVFGFCSREIREPDARLLQSVTMIGAQLGQFLLRKRVEAERAADEARLRESEARFRSLTGLSSDWYWEQDANFRFTAISGADARPIGAGGTSMYLGKTRWEIEHLAPLHESWEQHRASLDAHQSFRDVVFRRRMPDQTDRYMSVTGEPVFDASGRFAGYRGIGRDVTEPMREERLLALEHSVSRHLADAATEEEALGKVMKAICESERWESGRYFALDASGESMRFRRGWSAAIPEMQRFAEESRGISFRKGEGLVGIAWRDAAPVWSEDTSADPRVVQKSLAVENGLHGCLVLPITSGGQVIGAVSISSRQVRIPDQRLLQTNGVIGSQIGQFLKRKHGETAVREQSARLASIIDLQQQLAADGLDVESISTLLVEKSREIIGKGTAAIQFIEDGRFRYAAASDGGKHLVGATTPLAGNFSGAVVESRKALYCEDAQRDPRVDAAATARAGARSLIGAPLEHEGRVIGVLKMISSEPRSFDADQLGMLQLLAGIAGSAIQRRRAEMEMRRFRMAMDASLDAIYLTDPVAMRFIDINAAACERTGYSREEMLAMGPQKVVAIDAAQLKREYDEVIAAGDRGIRVERPTTTRGGRAMWTELNRKALRLGNELLIVTVARDVTGRKRAEERQRAHLRYQEKLAHFGEAALGRREVAELLDDALGTVTEALPACAVVYLEPQGSGRELILRAARGLPAGAAATGGPYRATEAVALPADRGELAIVDRTDQAAPLLPYEWAGEFRCGALVPVHGEGRSLGVLCVLSRASGTFGSEESKFLVTAASVLSAGMRRIDSEGRLAFLAQFDPLTGLPNRALLADRFSQMIVQARRHDRPLGVLFIDLDEFKLVNDSLGHAGGDELLKETALRLQKSVRPGDTVARISGDEFAVVLADLARADDAALVAQKIIDQFAAPFRIGGRELFVTASIGIAAYPADGDDAESLLGAADAAMYRAKQAGRNGYQFFTVDINQRTRARAQLGSELRRALERREFVLAYQPKFDLRGGKPCAAEALLRWRSPERGLVSPAEFIPVLEETGLIVAVGEWVLEQVCRDLNAWQAAGLQPLPVAVNLSARQFRHADLEKRIRAVVRRHGVDPRLIELEITESQVMQDPEHAKRVIQALNDDGMRVAIDDFGTGYSSLSCLTRFRVGALKIDRSFVANALQDPADATIVRTIVDMAHTLGFLVVAEGVETEAQAAFLRSLGCEQAQGYYFAKPMPEAELRGFLSPRAERRSAPVRLAQGAR